jgi:hypothetical protein
VDATATMGSACTGSACTGSACTGSACTMAGTSTSAGHNLRIKLVAACAALRALRAAGQRNSARLNGYSRRLLQWRSRHSCTICGASPSIAAPTFSEVLHTEHCLISGKDHVDADETQKILRYLSAHRAYVFAESACIRSEIRKKVFEARYLHLVASFLRGVPYGRAEQRCRLAPDFHHFCWVLAEFLPDAHLHQERLHDWLYAASRHLEHRVK